MDNTNEPESLPERPVSSDKPEDVQARIDFARSVVPRHQKHPARQLLIGLVLIVVIGLGVYWLFFSSKASPKHTSASSSKSQTQSSEAKNNNVTHVPTHAYNSSDFNVNFNYPDGWAVVDSGNGPMTVTSPSMSLTSASGKAVTGQIIMTVAKQGQLPAKFTAGTALAVLDSQEIAYTQPTAAQTSQTYVSFVQYSSTNTRGGLDAIFVTGNFGYQKDQIIPTSDIAGVDPFISLSFSECGNSACTTNLTPLTIASTSWNQSSFKAPIVTMLSSFAFQ